MAFTPTKKSDVSKTIKNYLLNGYIVRYDGRDETPLEVMDRFFKPYLRSMHNIGQEKGNVLDEIHCGHKILHDVIDELRKDYSVSKVFCASSGCCQYATYGYYIDGE